MSLYIDQRDVKIETVSFVEPLHNPALRSEEEGKMACKFNGDVLINGEKHFVDTAFVFSTSDFWTVDDILDINMFYAFVPWGENDKECRLSEVQQKQIVSELARQMTYDKYSWFTKTITKEAVAA